MVLFLGQRHAMVELCNNVFAQCYHWLGLAGLFVIATQRVDDSFWFTLGSYSNPWVKLQWTAGQLWYICLFGHSFYV